MTNEEYRKARGTDKPFTTTPEESKKVWFTMNKEVILARRKREKLFKGTRRLSRLDYKTNPLVYEVDDED